MRTASALLTVFALLINVQTVPAQEQTRAKGAGSDRQPAYYMCVFAYDSNPPQARLSHVFATFVKVEGESFEAHTISWLPQTNNVRLLRRFAEPGMNLGLQETLRLAASMQLNVTESGSVPDQAGTVPEGIAADRPSQQRPGRLQGAGRWLPPRRQQLHPCRCRRRHRSRVPAPGPDLWSRRQCRNRRAFEAGDHRAGEAPSVDQ